MRGWGLLGGWSFGYLWGRYPIAFPIFVAFCIWSVANEASHRPVVAPVKVTDGAYSGPATPRVGGGCIYNKKVQATVAGGRFNVPKYGSASIGEYGAAMINQADGYLKIQDVKHVLVGQLVWRGCIYDLRLTEAKVEDAR